MGFWPFFLPLFTRVRGRQILRSTVLLHSSCRPGTGNAPSCITTCRSLISDHIAATLPPSMR